MSTKNLYSIRDLVAEEFAPVFVANNDSTAIRMCAETVKDNKIMSSHLSDYALYNLGSFDIFTGEIKPNPLFSTPILMFTDFNDNKEVSVCSEN